MKHTQDWWFHIEVNHILDASKSLADFICSVFWSVHGCVLNI